MSIISIIPRRPTGVPVLLYHRLVEDHLYPSIPAPEDVFTVPESKFREQIDYLAEVGYKALTLEEFERILAGIMPAPERSVLLTFDDGCESVLRLAAPHLTRHGMPAVVFVTVEEASPVFQKPFSQRRLTNEELRKLELQGIRCESHGITHAGLSDLDDLSLQAELLQSKCRIKEIVGREVSSLALPLNAYDSRVIEKAGSLGYRTIFSSHPGLVRSGDDPLLLKRITVEGKTSLEEFRGLLSSSGILQRRILTWIKRLPPRLMGYRLWMPLRRRIFSSPIGRFLTPALLRRAVVVALLVTAIAIAGLLTIVLFRLIIA